MFNCLTDVYYRNYVRKNMPKTIASVRASCPELLRPNPGAAAVRSRKTEKPRNCSSAVFLQFFQKDRKTMKLQFRKFSAVFLGKLQQKTGNCSSVVFLQFFQENSRNKTQAEPWSGRGQEQKNRKTRKLQFRSFSAVFPEKQKNQETAVP